MPDANSYQGPGIYRHYKGGMYEVLNLVQNAESPDDESFYVVYRSLDTDTEFMWIRSLDNFNDKVVSEPVEGVITVPRFTKVSDARV